MITVTINGKKITLQKPVTILEAAKNAGINIPTLCHHEMLKAYGGCRLCLVEIERVPRLQTACSQPVTDGLIIWTETERVIEARKAVLEFLLINHPLDCPICDKAGECTLQDLVMKYGPTTGRFAEGKRKYLENYEDPLIVRNMERCIVCAKCVRMCDDVQGASAIAITNRGAQSYVDPFSGGRFNCEYCGNCLTVCPTGAVLSKMHKHIYRAWLIEKEVETVCSFCGVGCSMILQIRDNSIMRSIPKTKGLNKGLLCSKGRFGYDYIHNSNRLDTPLIKKNGQLQPASWEEAFAYIARRLKEIKEDKGSEAIAGIISGRCTNEDAYVFQKFFRLAIGSNNIDSSAGFAYGPAQKFLEKIFGQDVTANSIHGISNSDGVFVIGGDPAFANPILGLQIRSAYKKGIAVVTVGYAEGLRNFSSHQLVPNPLTETAFLAALVSEIRDKKTLSGERPAFEEMINKIQPSSLKDISDTCGIALNEIIETVTTLSNMTNPSIIVGREVVQTMNGHINLMLLASLVYLLNGRVYLMSELPNEQGLLDMGCQPDMLPSGRPLVIETFRRRCEEIFGAEIPSKPGLTFVEIIDAAFSGKIKALFVQGENILFSTPGTEYVRNAVNKLEFLVVQDIFLTETASIADVVLPGLSWAEKNGSYTNLERRIQFTKKAINAKGMEQWRAIAEISKVLGFDMNYNSEADIFSEIAKVSLLYKDLTFEDIMAGDHIWPYKGEPLRHDTHIEIELPDISSLMKKTETGKIYCYRDACLFYSENSSRYSSALQSISPAPYVKISNALADRLSIATGEYVNVSSENRNITLLAKRDPHLPENIVLIANLDDKGIFNIIPWKLNHAIKTPILDGNEVIIKKTGDNNNLS
jgi:NADH-quinone oxidoreductase chain G